MSTTAQIVTIIALLASLFLVTRGLQSHRLGQSAIVRMGVTWVLIIIGLVVLIRLIAP
jgi:hypothetical protein